MGPGFVQELEVEQAFGEALFEDGEGFGEARHGGKLGHGRHTMGRAVGGVNGARQGRGELAAKFVLMVPMWSPKLGTLP